MRLALNAVVVLVSSFFPASAQTYYGEFVVPAIRGAEGHKFTYWESFTQAYAAPNFARPDSEDTQGNPSNYNDNVTITQTEAVGAFVTGSGSIYSHGGATKFVIEYFHEGEEPVTGIICQFQTGGATVDLDLIRLTYSSVDAEGQPIEVTRPGEFHTYHEPGTGGFSDRVASGAEWIISPDDPPVGNFVIHVDSPAPSMPIYAAQLDVSTQADYQNLLGYLLDVRHWPKPQSGKPLNVTWLNPANGETRFFLPGETAELTVTETDPERFHFVGWAAPVGGTERVVTYTFAEEDISLVANWAPLSYQAWRETMFHHLITTGSEEDYVDDSISGTDADPDADGFPNGLEYAFGGTPYISDANKISPTIRVRDGVIQYQHRRWKLPSELQTTAFIPESSDDLQEWNVIDDIPSERSAIDNGDGTETVTMEIPSTLNGENQFLRLSIQPSSTSTN